MCVCRIYFAPSWKRFLKFAFPTTQEAQQTRPRFPDKAVLDAPKAQRRRLFGNGDIDLPSVLSIEMLEEGDEGQGEVLSRVTEMGRIVEDAQLYLQKKGDLGLKSNDSLLFIPRHGAGEGYNGEEATQHGDIISESEAESTPTNSPTHNGSANMLANAGDEEAKNLCSSFGLHSPHLFMSSFQQVGGINY